MTEQISNVNPPAVNMITTTLYPKWVPGKLQWSTGNPVTPDIVDKVRGDLAIETISAASEKGARVIVVDGANIRPFRQTLDTLDRRNVLIYDEIDQGISASRQQGFSIAHTMSDRLINLWTEPEKVSIVRDCLEQLTNPIFRGEADLTIPLRDEASFATFPEYQAEVAGEANRLWNDLLKAEELLSPGHSGYDVWFGPLCWHKDITGLFLRKYRTVGSADELIKPDEYCNANYFPIIAALAERKRVLSVQVSYRHSEIQTAIENYNPAYEAVRRHQLYTIIETTKYYLALLRGESSKLAQIV